MAKVKQIHNYKDLIRRSITIKNIYDVFDMVHENMTADEVKQACLNLYALKIKENPDLLMAFKKRIPSDIPFSKRKFYEKQKNIIRSNPIFFSEEDFRKVGFDIYDMPENTSGLFLQSYEVIIISKKFFQNNYKKNPFNILISVYHELEHLSQKYEKDPELLSIYHNNRLSSMVVNEKVVKELLKKNHNNISKAMKEFKQLPDREKYIDLFDFVNIDKQFTNVFYDYCTFDECLENDLPIIEEKIEYNTFKEIQNQLSLASTNFYINSPVEIDAKMHELQFGFCMSEYAKLMSNPIRRDWIVKKLEDSSYNAFRASDHKEAEGLFEEMINEKTPNQKINLTISQAKYKVDARKKARETIVELFNLPVKKEFSEKELKSLKKVATFYIVACYENGLIPYSLSMDCSENYHKLITAISFKTYYRDNSIKAEIDSFINKKVVSTKDELKAEILKDKKKRNNQNEDEFIE